ncbi:MAG: DUF309 domain-containing protein [Terrimicrobiaceae bacterium]|nr:DUF309 domain-containing protein [Terrimicrobiaceae bacterium]
MKKGQRIEAFVQSLSLDDDGQPACYLAYFECFNAGDYYEAHDVLEHLWLDETGPDYAFYKGLIQIAGAFVHLRKQFERPEHPKDGRRLRPAVRLFELGIRNIQPFAPIHRSLDVLSVVAMCRDYCDAIIGHDYATNPWNPNDPPQLQVPAGASSGR